MGKEGDNVQGALTFDMKAVQDIYSHSINLQLTGALPLNTIQD